MLCYSADWAILQKISRDSKWAGLVLGIHTPNERNSKMDVQSSATTRSAITSSAIASSATTSSATTSSAIASSAIASSALTSSAIASSATTSSALLGKRTAPGPSAGRSLTRHAYLETVPDWALTEFLRVCHRDTDELACVVPLYEDGMDFAFGASISEGVVGFVAWMSAVDEASFLTVFGEARRNFAAGLFLPRWSETPKIPLGEDDEIIEVSSDDLMGGFRDRESFRCVLFGVNGVAEPRRGGEAFLPLMLRLPVANTPHPSLRPHPAWPGWKDHRYDETPDVDDDQKYITFHRCVRVDEFERGTRVTLDQPIVIFAKRERRFDMSVVSSATFSYGRAGMWDAREYGNLSVDSGDPLIVTFFDGRLVLSSIAFSVWVVRGWYMDPYGRRPDPTEDRFGFGSFAIPFVEVGAARRIQRFWRRLRCDPHHPVGNKLLRMDFAKE